MTNLNDLEAAFSTAAAQRLPAVFVTASIDVTGAYDRRLASLRGARNSRYVRCLDGGHDYPSDSEASLAVVNAMVARHFTDGEIWATLQSSTLDATRAAKKGEEHARALYMKEIEMARQRVMPFEDDPGKARHRSDDVRDVPLPHVQPDAAPPSVALPPLTIPAGDGWLPRYLRYASVRTDAPLEAHQLMAVVALSALAGPMVRLPIATSRHGWNLCLWGMYIVSSTVGRKTTTIGLAKDILIEVLGPTAIIEWEGSPQGLIQRLQDRDGQSSVFARDEYSGLMAQMNRGGGHLAGLQQLFIRTFDGGVLENIRTRKKVPKDGPKVEDTDRVEHPYLPKLTASTRDSFVERCTIDNVLDGYLARFIFVTGAAKPRPLPIQTAAMHAEFDALVEHARGFAAKAGDIHSVDLDESARLQAWELEQRWGREAELSAHPDAAGPALKRLSESVLKIAALLAIDGAQPGEQTQVTTDLFGQAVAMAERWKVSTLEIIDALGATSFMRDTEAVLRTIAGSPNGIQVRDVLRRHRRLRQREFAEILDILAEREEITVVTVPGANGRGRSKRVAYRFGHAPEHEQPNG